VLRIFRSNQLLLSVLLIGYAAFLRVAYFLTPIPDIPVESGLANHWVLAFVQGQSTLNFNITILLLFTQAFLANKIFFENRLTRDLSLYPGVFLILVGSMLPEFLNYSSFLPANIFLLLAIRELLKAYRKLSTADTLFNVGFFIGIATLFQPIYILFLIAAGGAVIKLKSGKFRDQFIMWAGALVPLFLIGTYYFFYDKLPEYWMLQWDQLISLPQTFDWKQLPFPSIAIMLSLLLFVLLSAGKILSKTKMEVQIKIGTIYWFVVVAIVCLLLSQPWHSYRWQLLVPMLGLLLGISFTKARPLPAEVWHFVLLIILFLFHFTQSFTVAVF